LADLCIFFITVFINTALVVFGIFFTKRAESIHGIVYAYSNPFDIVGALYLLIFFSKVKMPYVKVINWLGASSFAVYLFHGETTIRNSYFCPIIQNIYNDYSGVACVGMIFLFLCFIYMVSISIDQLRILSWNRIYK